MTLIRNADPADDRFLAALDRVSQRARRAQNELITGKRLFDVSDDPDQVADLLQVRAGLAETAQHKFNLGRIRTEVDSAERALDSAVNVMERARVLASRGASTANTAQTRRVLAAEAAALVEQLVIISSTRVEGRHIFAGDLDQTVPYIYDETLPFLVSSYGGSKSTRQAIHPGGTTFAISKSADEIFDNPDATRNAFGAIRGLRDALLNNDQVGITESINNIQTATEHMNIMQAFYGVVQGRVQHANDFAHKAELRLSTQLAGIEDADLISASVRLQRATTESESALLAKARSNRQNLFDYLA